MIATPVNAHTIDKACEALTNWIHHRARRMSLDVGFSYDPVESGHPETFEALKAEFKECMVMRRGFRVWSGASDKTIYTNAEGNYAFRFVHDMMHVCFNLSMSVEDEIRVAQRRVAEVIHQFGEDSIEARLMALDTAGQVLYFCDHGEFVVVTEGLGGAAHPRRHRCADHARGAGGRSMRVFTDAWAADVSDTVNMIRYRCDLRNGRATGFDCLAVMDAADRWRAHWVASTNNLSSPWI